MNTSPGYARAAAGALCGWLVTCLALIAAADDPVPPRRGEKAKETPAQKQAGVYRKQFEKAGRAGLAELTKDQDTGLALQASWEAHKTVVKLPKPRIEQFDSIYDADELKKFLAFLQERTKAPVPDWWEKGVLDLYVETGGPRWHVYRGEVLKLEEVKLGQTTWGIRKGAAVTLRGDTVSYQSGDVSLDFPKALLSEPIRGAFADVSAEKITCLAGYTSSSGFGFKLIGFETQGSKRLWEAGVWAVDRREFIGSTALHRVELTTKGDTVFVFGAEMLGAYVEAFDLATGKCQFRFCTSYWGNYSEAWDLK